MKKIMLVVVSLIVLMVVGIWYFLFTSQTSHSIQSEANQIKNEQQILLYAESGDVSFKTNTASEFQKVINSPTTIPNQSVVHTDIGKASVLLPDNSTISLENNTEIIVNYSSNKTSIFQNFGVTYHRVQKLITGSIYQVQTEGTLAAVRGTKFAVRYDKTTKKTKIAVTESKVEVSSLPKFNGTTTPVGESILLEAGKMVSVDSPLATDFNTMKSVSSMKVSDTSNDKEMNDVVEKQKDTDVKIETIKKSSINKEDFRKEMRRVLFEDKKEGVSENIEQTELRKDIKKSTENKENAKEDVVEEKKVIKENKRGDVARKIEPVTEQNREIASLKEDTPTFSTQNDISTVKKMTEDEFFPLFETLFIKYFYIDDVERDSACSVKVTPEERVKIVTSFAKNSGNPFESATLQSFAVAVDEYCRNGNKDMKVKLQSRFDDEYPFH